MGTVADPRKEVLAASRFRSGSLQREKSTENMPPSLQPRTDKSESPTRQRTTVENHGTKSSSRPALFGSNVSKIKEMFQANAPPSLKVDQYSHHSQPDVEKSPEIKRKRTEPVSTRTKPTPAPAPQSEHGLLDATNHVQRFIHTRALFARLEGTNQQASSNEQKQGISTPSPILSPNTSTPTSPTGSKHSDDQFHLHERISPRHKYDNDSSVTKSNGAEQRDRKSVV